MPVSAHRIALAVATLAAIYLAVLYAVRPVPVWALALYGGPASAVERDGGLRLSVRRPDGTIEVQDAPGVSPAAAEETSAIVRAGGLEIARVIESRTFENLKFSGAPEGELALDFDSWTDPERGTRTSDTYVRGFDRARLEAVVRGVQLPPETRVVYERVQPALEARDQRPYWRTYLVSTRIALRLAVADAGVSNDPNTKRFVVIVDLERSSAQAFGDLTRDHVGHKLAMLVGDEVRSAPIVMTPISGRRVWITMGSNEPAVAEREATALATTLKLGTPQNRGEVLATQPVAQVVQPVRAWLSRLTVALLGGLLAGALAWLLVRVLEPRRHLPTRLAGDARVWPRVAWTVGALVVFLAGSQVSVPGDFAEQPGVFAPEQLTIFGLGIGPLILGFLVVEVGAAIAGAIRPSWRSWRHGGAAGRNKLGPVIAVVGLAFAIVEGHWAVRSAQPWFPGWGPHLLQLATIVGGTMLLAVLASSISSRGIGNGYAVLLLASWVGDVKWSELIDAGASGAFAAVAFSVIAVVLSGVLAGRVGRDGGAKVPLPTAGMVPIADAAGLVLIVGVMRGLGLAPWFTLVDWSIQLQSWLVLELPVVAISTIVWSAVFVRRVELATWLRATAASLVALVALAMLAGIATQTVPAAALLLGPSALLAIATALDLYDELRDRRAGLVPVWPLHAPLLADTVRERLTAANIPHHLQASRLRTLLWFFGPYVPIQVLAPADRAEEAARVVAALFEERALRG